MSMLTLRSSLPSWTSDLFDTGRLLGNNLWDFDGGPGDWDFAARVPSVNITETEKDFRFEMAAPGLEKKDFKVNVENDTLTISAEKKEESKEEKKNYTRREYSFNSFKRSFRLPENCLPEKVDAKYENGVLHLTLPKKSVTVSKPVKEIKIS